MLGFDGSPTNHLKVGGNLGRSSGGDPRKRDACFEGKGGRVAGVGMTKLCKAGNGVRRTRGQFVNSKRGESKRGQVQGRLGKGTRSKLFVQNLTGRTGAARRCGEKKKRDDGLSVGKKRTPQTQAPDEDPSL